MMATPPNDMGVDYDKPGFCALCHVQIADFNGSDIQGNPIVTRLRTNYTDIVVRLDDASAMKVTLCTNCRGGIKPEDMQELMESVIRGWAWEVKHRLKWDEPKRKDHMDRYEKRHVVTAENMRWNKDDIKKIKKPRKSKMEVA